MEITLTRIAKQDTYTIGRLEIDGTYFCDTLEPAWRDIGPGKPAKKIPGKTAIPEGRYAVAVTFSPRFKRWLPLLLHVPMFEGIRIHAGNSSQDTAGCILPGLNTLKGRVTDSRIWEKRIVHKLAERPEGEGVWITIK
ncbi:DUF5675 family protein [uncultured Phocaeicola sp.]|uniref:DUF5675 family protein n=1 Tax=uncultured Phocaeicola sp. TaxID=990718 RepID=UPI0025F14139|nr:DUF5675 family protein [uncultured Phocaeicola sp.]